jgi:hypothetical protein
VRTLRPTFGRYIVLLLAVISFLIAGMSGIRALILLRIYSLDQLMDRPDLAQHFFYLIWTFLLGLICAFVIIISAEVGWRK